MWSGPDGQPQNSKARFTDKKPLRPMPPLGTVAEPDKVPPMCADMRKICVLSTSDEVRLHGLGVEWDSKPNVDLLLTKKRNSRKPSA